LPGPRFEAYLREEGLDEVIEARANARRSDHPGLERFSRYAKSLIFPSNTARLTDGDPALAGGTDDLYDRELGLPLELVLETNDNAPLPPRENTPMTIRLRLRGEPLEGALVRMEPTSGSTDWMTARSGSDGRVEFTPTESGHWMIGAVFMEPSPPGTGARWDSLWASLTFEVGPSPAADGIGEPAKSSSGNCVPLPPEQESQDSVDSIEGCARRSHS